MCGVSAAAVAPGGDLDALVAGLESSWALEAACLGAAAGPREAAAAAVALLWRASRAGRLRERWEGLREVAVDGLFRAGEGELAGAPLFAYLALAGCADAAAGRRDVGLAELLAAVMPAAAPRRGRG